MIATNCTVPPKCQILLKYSMNHIKFNPHGKTLGDGSCHSQHFVNKENEAQRVNITSLAECQLGLL